MKKGGTAADLKSFYAHYPRFNGINDLLQHLWEASIAYQKYIEEYFWTNGKMDKKDKK